MKRKKALKIAEVITRLAGYDNHHTSMVIFIINKRKKYRSYDDILTVFTAVNDAVSSGTFEVMEDVYRIKLLKQVAKLQKYI